MEFLDEETKLKKAYKRNNKLLSLVKKLHLEILSEETGEFLNNKDIQKLLKNSKHAKLKRKIKTTNGRRKKI